MGKPYKLTESQIPELDFGLVHPGPGHLLDSVPSCTEPLQSLLSRSR